MSSVCRVRVTGPLAMYADGFWADLAAQGYVAESADRNVRTLAHLSRWMDLQVLSADQLSAGRLEEFLAARRREGYHHARSLEWRRCLRRRRRQPWWLSTAVTWSASGR